MESAIDETLRVDWAGEKGAVALYAGQLAALGRHHPVTPLIQHMAAQEERHAEAFEGLIKAHNARPSLLMPLWEKAGWLAGWLTGRMGPEAAMACTTAVEEVIDAHYKEQIDALAHKAPALATFLNTCREEEVDHMHTGLAHGATQAPFSQTLQALIRWGTRGAIAVAKRL